MLQKVNYRPFAPGRIQACLWVRSAGHYCMEETFLRDVVKVKDFLQLFWSVRGEGEFLIAGQSHLLRPGEICCYFPGDCHDVRCRQSPWEYYWLTLDGPDLPFLQQCFQLQREPRPAGPCPVELFNSLCQSVREYSLNDEYAASARAYEILTLAAAGIQPQSAPVREFRRIVGRRFADPALSVQEICREMGIHRSTLTRILRRESGLSPVEFLIRYRLQEAMTLLAQRRCSIKQVAALTGFSSQGYFSKTFRRRFGFLPSTFTGH